MKGERFPYQILPRNLHNILSSKKNTIKQVKLQHQENQGEQKQEWPGPAVFQWTDDECNSSLTTLGTSRHGQDTGKREVDRQIHRKYPCRPQCTEQVHLQSCFPGLIHLWPSKQSSALSSLYCTFGDCGQPPLLKAEQVHLPQLLTAHHSRSLRPSWDQLGGPRPDLLWFIKVFLVLGSPKLDTIFQI